MHNKPCGIYKDQSITHFAIYTDDDCLDILSFTDNPVVEILPAVSKEDVFRRELQAFTRYSHPPKASYGVASPRRTKAYCLRRRALSETFGGWLYSAFLILAEPVREWYLMVTMLFMAILTRQQTQFGHRCRVCTALRLRQ